MKVTLHESTLSAPRLLAFQKWLFIAWAGNESEDKGLLHLMRSTDGQWFGEPDITDQVIGAEELSFSHFGDHLCYVVRNPLTHAPVVVASNDELRFAAGAGAVGGLDKERSKYAPAICHWKNQLFIAWVGADERINVAAFDGTTIRDKVTLADSAGAGVALAAAPDQLFLAWAGKGEGRQLNVLASQDGKSFGNRSSLGEESSDHTPSIAWWNNKLYLAWTGRFNGKLNLISSDDLAHFSGKQILNESSNQGPSLEVFNGKLWLAWKGTDVKSRPNVMSFDQLA